MIYVKGFATDLLLVIVTTIAFPKSYLRISPALSRTGHSLAIEPISFLKTSPAAWAVARLSFMLGFH
jgi:hypothetical protein